MFSPYHLPVLLEVAFRPDCEVCMQVARRLGITHDRDPWPPTTESRKYQASKCGDTGYVELSGKVVAKEKAEIKLLRDSRQETRLYKRRRCAAVVLVKQLTILSALHSPFETGTAFFPRLF